MQTIEMVIRQINREFVPQFQERLRAYLAQQDKEWLIDQIIRMALDAHSLEAMDRKLVIETKARQRAERISKLHEMGLDDGSLAAFTERCLDLTRERLIQEGFLLETAPEKGTHLISRDFRTEKGEQLLEEAKVILFGLLFGGSNARCQFERTQRELLAFALPRFKSHALDFMKASTEYAAAGTWQDPDSISNDVRADNVMFEVEFGEVEGEHIGRGIICALRLINNLEVNEQILYARMINVEETTLIE